MEGGTNEEREGGMEGEREEGREGGRIGVLVVYMYVTRYAKTNHMLNIFFRDFALFISDL